MSRYVETHSLGTMRHIPHNVIGQCGNCHNVFTTYVDKCGKCHAPSYLNKKEKESWILRNGKQYKIRGWITSRGHRVPLLDGYTKLESTKEFYNDFDSKPPDHNYKTEWKINKKFTSEQTKIMKDTFDSLPRTHTSRVRKIVQKYSRNTGASGGYFLPRINDVTVIAGDNTLGIKYTVCHEVSHADWHGNATFEQCEKFGKRMEEIGAPTKYAESWKGKKSTFAHSNDALDRNISFYKMFKKHGSIPRGWYFTTDDYKFYNKMSNIIYKKYELGVTISQAQETYYKKNLKRYSELEEEYDSLTKEEIEFHCDREIRNSESQKYDLTKAKHNSYYNECHSEIYAWIKAEDDMRATAKLYPESKGIYEDRMVEAVKAFKEIFIVL